MGRRARRFSRSAPAVLGALVGTIVGLTPPSAARAHGRPAALGAIVAQPGAPDRLVAQATWGLALSDDGGATWRWLCAAALGVDARNEDPAIVVTAAGAILAGTFGGLLRSEDGGCTWSRPDESLRDVFVVELVRGGGDRLLAVASVPGVEDRLFASEDGGRGWRALGGFGEILVDRLRVAPSDPDRIYASGAMPSDGSGPRRAFALRSDDGGATFARFELPLEEGERLLHVWAVDPRDPDVVYGQVLHFNGEEAPERIVRSEDGGASWETVLRIPYVGGVLVTAEGAVYAGSRLGGLHRSDDGRSFEVLDPARPVTCLAELRGTPWACVDEGLGGHALARADDGRRFEPVANLADFGTMASCPRCSPTGIECAAWAPDVAFDLGLDASLPPEFALDGGTGRPRDAGVPSECLPDGGSGGGAPSGCGCRAASRSSEAPWALLASVAGLSACRRRRRR